MKRLAIVGACILAGCASPQELRQRAMNTPEPDLCYLAASGRVDVRQAAFEAIQSRRVDCNAYAAMIAARIQRDQASTDLGLQLLRAGQARPTPAPPATTCRTYNRGTYLQTVCD